MNELPLSKSKQDNYVPCSFVISTNQHLKFFKGERGGGFYRKHKRTGVTFA